MSKTNLEIKTLSIAREEINRLEAVNATLQARLDSYSARPTDGPHPTPEQCKGRMVAAESRLVAIGKAAESAGLKIDLKGDPAEVEASFASALKQRIQHNAAAQAAQIVEGQGAGAALPVGAPSSSNSTEGRHAQQGTEKPSGRSAAAALFDEQIKNSNPGA